MYPRTHLWLLITLLVTLTRSETEGEQTESADEYQLLADESKSDSNSDSDSDEAEADDDAFLDSDKKKKLKVSLPLSPRCRHILTVLNFQRRFAKSIDSHAVKAIEKSNGKVVATLVKEHIHNAENTLLSKINGSSQHVRFKLREWLNSTLKLRELLLSTKLKGAALQFSEIMGNIARLVVELILCIYH